MWDSLWTWIIWQQLLQVIKLFIFPGIKVDRCDGFLGGNAEYNFCFVWTCSYCSILNYYMSVPVWRHLNSKLPSRLLSFRHLCRRQPGSEATEESAMFACKMYAEKLNKIKRKKNSIKSTRNRRKRISISEYTVLAKNWKLSYSPTYFWKEKEQRIPYLKDS